MVSADGRTISATQEEDSSVIYTGPSPDGELKGIETQKDDAYELMFLPDGNLLTETFRHKLFTMKINGTARTPLSTENLAGMPVRCGKDLIAFMQLSDEGLSIWHMDLDGANHTMIAKDAGVPVLNTSTKSIEELATTILLQGKLDRHIF